MSLECTNIVAIATDAQVMATNNPDTFEAPTSEELNSILKQDHVKICCHKERFWVSVNEVVDTKISGFIDNDLIHTHEHGLKYNDKIEFEKRHVYSIVPANKN